MAYQLRVLEPGVVEVGDLYVVANSHGGVSLARISHVNEKGFGYEGENFGGNVSYNGDSGIIIRETGSDLEICVNEAVLEAFRRYLASPQVDPEIELKK